MRAAMPGVWRRAPLALLSYRALLLATVCAALLTSFTAAAAPLVSESVESSALKNKVEQLSPYAAGLELHDTLFGTPAEAARADAARERAVARIRATTPGLGAPVQTLTTGALSVSNPATAGSELFVFATSRPGALAHVDLLTPRGRPGVWISSAVATQTHLKPGGVLHLAVFAVASPPITVSWRVAGVYRTLTAADTAGYWANELQEIRSPNPDAPPQPTFVFASRSQILALALHLGVSGHLALPETWELPLDPHSLTLASARATERRFAAVHTALVARGGSLSTVFGCRIGPLLSCSTSSSVSSALILARNTSGSIAATVALLAGLGLVLALAVSGAAGVFLARKRAAELQLAYARGESAVSFATRVAVEALAPTLLGAVAGLGVALGLVGAFAPHGTLDGAAVGTAIWRAAAAAGGALALLAGAVALSFPHRARERSLRRALRFLPWELFALALAAAAFLELQSGNGLTRSAGGVEHPKLTVFVLPLLAVAGVAGLVARLTRRVVPRPDGGGLGPYLAFRRLASARGIVVVVCVALAVSLGTLFYAEGLTESLNASAAEKAYIGTGADVAAVIDASATLPPRFAYPLTKVDTWYGGVQVGGAAGTDVDLMVVDPATLTRELRWSSRWGPDPGPLLRRLDAPGPLPAIAVGGTVPYSAFWDQDVRIPMHVVGTLPVFPGMVAGDTLLVVSAARLDAAAARAHLLVPVGESSATLWARGPSRPVEEAIAHSSLGADFLYSAGDVLHSQDVRETTRTYGFLRAIAIAAAALAVVALLLYLQTRQRSQVVGYALGRRMGLRPLDELLALAVEVAAMLLVAAVVGAVVAVAAAWPLVHHIDPLPQLPTTPSPVIPWLLIGIVAASLAVVSLLLAGAALLSTSRADVGENLRVV
jgi:putative ABC transport system permease protein